MTEQEKQDLIIDLEAADIEYNGNVACTNASYWLGKAIELLESER